MSTDGAPRPTNWKDLYQLAVIETNPAKMLQRISDARNAVLDRIKENGMKPHDYHEHEELSDAVNGLRVLQQEYQDRVQRYGEPRQKMG